ncbi:MAG: DNA repair protein RecN [Desulfosalsimonadaceae bacterium]
MLSELAIKNFAIIDDLTIRLSEGFTIFSGETGAGKSIIINAVNLLLGSRASARMIRTGAETAELSALFYLPEDSPASALLCEHGLEAGGELLIRRVISASHRHKIYINDRLATMQLLSEVTDNLAAISGQHEHQRLLKESRHLLILDQFAGLMPLRQEVGRCYRRIAELSEKLRELQNSRQKQDEHTELLRYQQQEIADAAVSPGEDTSLKEELLRLKNAEMLYQTVAGAVESLYSAEGAAAERVAEVEKSLSKAAVVDAELAPSSEALADITARIEDAAEQLRSYLDTITFDERRLEHINARLDLLTRLKRKYGGSLEAVIARGQEIQQELDALESLSENIAETESSLEIYYQKALSLCHELSEKRHRASDELAARVEAELGSLKMPNTRFEVLLENAPAGREQSPYLQSEGAAITESGMERARFMIAPNPGEQLRPLSSIASGGELSRVILALKAIMADSDMPGTLIFDEVDAGIGGEAAEMIGKKLAQLSGLHQVICITHLAQIARFGHHHFKITKKIEGERTRTCICKLAGEDRVEETARMIGGAAITRTSRQHAREMLEGR